MSRGNKAYNQLQFSDALVYYKQSYNKSKGLFSNKLNKDASAEKIADCYWLMRNYDSAYIWYQKLPLSFPDPTGKIQYRKAELYAIAGDYTKASSQLSSVYGYAERATGFLRVDRMKRDSADWNLSYLQNINTDYFREFSPVLLDSGMAWATNQPTRYSKKAVLGWDNMGYARMIQVDDTAKLDAVEAPAERKLLDELKVQESGPDYLARHYPGADVQQLASAVSPRRLKSKMKYIDSLTTPVKGMEKFSYNLAHATYHKETNKIYFSANRQDKLKGQVRTVAIIEATKNENGVSNPRFSLGIDDVFSNMHPAIHPDGVTLVFSSNREGGKGGYDLYYVIKESDGTWTTPVLVAGANTIGNELFASFAPDGTLYFSSDGHPGLGGLDIYRGQFLKGRVSKMEHLSYPLNSPFDDFGMSFTGDDKAGYFTSDKLGSDDIYSFQYAPKSVDISARVISEQLGRVVPGVKINLLELDEEGNTHPMGSSVTDAEGKFYLPGRPNRDYRVTATSDLGNAAADFNTNGVFERKTLDDIIIRYIKPKEVAQPKTVIAQVPDTFTYIIYFDFDKASVKSDARKVLNEVVEKLKEDPAYKVALYGHTDEAGADRYNDKLAASRTSNARAYLLKNGVRDATITYSSFGKKFPAIQGASRKAARFNRRVEISIRK
jgi:outer membrane protein OmpA-like peptidoglycan-associated protein/tetratricopeptide (TPR) repeat protein